MWRRMVMTMVLVGLALPRSAAAAQFEAVGPTVTALAPAGDVNGDGYDDLIAGVPESNQRTPVPRPDSSHRAARRARARRVVLDPWRRSHRGRGGGSGRRERRRPGRRARRSARRQRGGARGVRHAEPVAGAARRSGLDRLPRGHDARSVGGGGRRRQRRRAWRLRRRRARPRPEQARLRVRHPRDARPHGRDPRCDLERVRAAWRGRLGPARQRCRRRGRRQRRRPGGRDDRRAAREPDHRPVMYAGEAYLVLGSRTGQRQTVRFFGATPRNSSGASVAGAGDVNGDATTTS